MRCFWAGFYKKAAFSTGGSGHTGLGKGNFLGQLTRDHYDGTLEAHGRTEDDTRTDKTMIDRDRTARDFAVGERGPEFRDGSNPHILY